MHHLRNLALVLCAATMADPAAATSMGLYVEGGPGITQLSPDGGGAPRTFVPFVPRFGLWVKT